MSEIMKSSLEKHEQRVRQRVWYKRYKELAELLVEDEPINLSPVRILEHIDRMINNAYGYGYAHIASSAHESLKLVVKDMGWEWKK